MNKKRGAIIFLILFIVTFIIGGSVYLLLNQNISYSYFKTINNVKKDEIYDLNVNENNEPNFHKLFSVFETVFSKTLLEFKDNELKVEINEPEKSEKINKNVKKETKSLKKETRKSNDLNNNQNSNNSQTIKPNQTITDNEEVKKDEQKKEETIINSQIDKTNITAVKKETINEDDITDYKFGIKLITTTTYEVTTYSDGTIDKVKKRTSKKYDKNGYSATTTELKSEAESVVNKNSSTYNEVLSYTNEFRSEVESPNLTLDHNLSVAATIRAMEMAYSNKFDHTRPSGKAWHTACSESGTSCYAENIAAGQSNSKAVTTSWRNSPGHYANMTNKEYTKLGVGKYQLDGYLYWVQLFK